LALGTFNIVRAFNYPAKRYDRDAFHAGWTLRTLEDIGNIQTGRILVEKGERWVPFPILALVNAPEKFTRLDEGKVGQACDKGFQGNACQTAIQSYNLMILSSADKVLDFKKMFNGRSWQIGKYHVFELNASAKQSTNSRDSSRILSETPESWSRCWLLGERTD
jgi:hypothetical protein